MLSFSLTFCLSKPYYGYLYSFVFWVCYEVIRGSELLLIYESIRVVIHQSRNQDLSILLGFLELARIDSCRLLWPVQYGSETVLINYQR